VEFKGVRTTLLNSYVKIIAQSTAWRRDEKQRDYYEFRTL